MIRKRRYRSNSHYFMFRSGPLPKTILFPVSSIILRAQQRAKPLKVSQTIPDAFIQGLRDMRPPQVVGKLKFDWVCIK